MVFKIYAAVFGAMIGSFLGLLIHRLPRNLNIITPRSRCENCQKLVYWYENIPILSYFFLKGKCSGCGSRISIRYPFIEIICALMGYWLFPNTIGLYGIVLFLFYFFVFSAFIVHFFIDLDFKILPDSINLFLGILFLSFSFFHYSWQFWFLGGLIGFIVPFGVTYLFYLVKGQIGLGGGDIKLYSALGVLLGPMGIFQNLFYSCLIGSVIGGGYLLFTKKSRNTPIPFGPFILIAAFFQIYFPDLSHRLFTSLL